MVILWIFTNYLSRAYDSWLLPLIGFFVLPTTTLTYAIAQNSSKGEGIHGFGFLLVILGVLFDLGIWGSGRGAFSTRKV
ncbi:MAG: hypothetical protein QOH26_1090 [Actinomycetota bacterium]|jgi:hypothetical protein|nr:hypothetical protein [Actinomycetota bacterium]